tara:strand:- start:566 stop:1108 length:543 start_codon:yes stop_codon:yes gene_type:complete
MSVVDIEMVFDPIEMATMDGLKLDERHHICPESQWLRAVKRTTGRDDLFVYYHKETEKFVLAQWIFTPEKDGAAICTELEVMDKAPDRGGWISLEYIKRRCAKGDEMMKSLRRKVKEASYRKKAEKEELLQQRTETANHYRRKGMEDVAASVESSNYQKPSEELLDKLNTSASGKIITSG